MLAGMCRKETSSVPVATVRFGRDRDSHVRSTSGMSWLPMPSLIMRTTARIFSACWLLGFSYFVSSITATIASGLNNLAGWDLHPLEKRHLLHGARQNETFTTALSVGSSN